MPEPTSYIMAKLASGIGGLFGGLALMSFIKPKTIGDAALRGGISTGSGIIFSSPSLVYLNMRTDWEMQLMAGMIIGFISWSVLSMVARVFEKAEEDKSDIFDFVKNTKSKVSEVRGSTKKTTKRKRPAKK